MADVSTAALESEITLRVPASLQLRDVAKHYGGLHAVDGVSASAEPGEVLGVAGPNGAGKTTLFDVVTGLAPATAGDVLLGGQTLTGMSVHDRCHAGMARTFQQPTVAGSLSVYENILVSARYSRAADRWSGLGGNAREDAERVLNFSQLDHLPDEPAELLGVFDKKRLMIATALAMGPSVLLLDEPFGGLNPNEIARTVQLIRGVAALGVTVVCIEHVMRALVQIAGRVLVMHHGRVFFEGTPEEMLQDRRVIEIYLGEKAAKRARG